MLDIFQVITPVYLCDSFPKNTSNSTRNSVDEYLPLDKVDAQQLFDYVYEEPYSFIYVNLFMPKKERVFRKFNQLILSDLKNNI